MSLNSAAQYASSRLELAVAVSRPWPSLCWFGLPWTGPSACSGWRGVASGLALRCLSHVPDLGQIPWPSVLLVPSTIIWTSNVNCADGLDCMLHDSDCDASDVEASSQHEDDATIPLIPLPTNQSFLDRSNFAHFVSWDPEVAWRMCL